MSKKLLIVVILVVLAIVIAITIWCKLYRVVPQPAWISAKPQDSYFYGTVAAGNAEGIPYWLWLDMPRLFPEYMPRPGGYAALGMAWEEGVEMPIGFAKQRIGYIRVTGNCALCHATSNRSTFDTLPTIVPVSAGHVTDIQPLLTFFTRCAQDPRFDAGEFLSDIDTMTKLSVLDRLLYRYILVPRARKALASDPAAVLFDPALRAHARDPKSEAPFADPQMKALRDWMKQQETSSSK